METQKEKVAKLKRIINSNQNITVRQKRNIAKDINEIFDFKAKKGKR